MRIKILLDAMDKVSGPIGKIRAESRKAATDLRATQTALGKLEKAQADLKGFRDLKRGIQTTSQAMDQAQARARRLAAEIAATERPTQKMTRDFARAKREAADLGRQFQTQQRDLQAYRDRLDAAGYSTRRLGDAEKLLKTRIEDTTRELKQRRKAMADLQETSAERLRRAQAEARVDGEIEREQDRRRTRRAERIKEGASLVGLAITAATTATGIEAAKTDAALQSRMTDISLKAQLTREQADRLRHTLEELGPTIYKLPSELAGGVDTLLAKGLDAQGIERIVDKLGRASFAYKVPMEELSDAGFAAINNLDIAKDRIGRIVDIMAAGDEKGGFGVPAMATELKALTASYKALGQTGEDALVQLVAALQVLEPAAGSESEAANNLNNLLNKIYSEDTEKRFKKFGVDLPAALKKAEREGRDPLETLAQLTQKALGGDMSRLSWLFGDAQVQAAMRPLIQGLEKYRKMRDEIDKSDNAVHNAFVRRATDTEAKWQKLQANWERFSGQIGEKMRPVTNRALDFANGFFEEDAKQNKRGYNSSPALAQVEKIRAAEKARHTAKAIEQKAADEAIARQRQTTARILAESENMRAQLRQRFGLMRGESQALGQNMMRGIEDGINGRWPSVRARVEAIARQMKTWFADVLKIRSPSRVFMEMGGNITDGLAIGIDRGTRGPLRSIRTVATGLAAAGAPSGGGGASGAAAAQPASNRNYYLTIYQQPGQDAQDLARMVADEFDKRERQQASASRSAFRDRGD
ncbi:phage tail tape measure protein [Sphingobium yanoikuyae]|uniref:phage tail tape measure protein n=1 Tax=Sphingobium yanoikuyae TaxID=13690 RepID=UPI0014804E95|nr:phage tail tape measure protein [Sphingobium yanoikuyae]